MTCKIIKYRSGEPYDAMLPLIVNTIRKERINTDDDYTLFVCGSRGTGKSTLGLHMVDYFLEDKANVNCIGLNPEDFAKALKFAAVSEKPKLCMNDEANISRRDSGRTYNKDLLDLYYSIRGENIFHIWNNPSLDIIDKRIVEDILNGVIYIFTKNKSKPILYYFFTKKAILRILEKEEKLSLKILKKHATTEALYRGWFRDYKGKLKQPYLDKKGERMKEKINEFYNKYGIQNDFLSLKTIKEIIGVKANETVHKYIKELKEENKLLPEHELDKADGKSMYKKEVLQMIQDKIKEKKKNYGVVGRQRMIEYNLRKMRERQAQNEQ